MYDDAMSLDSEYGTASFRIDGCQPLLDQENMLPLPLHRLIDSR